MKTVNKKGNMNTMVDTTLGIVVLVFVLVMGYLFIEKLRNTTTTNSSAYNASIDLEGSNGLGLVKTLAPLAIIVLIFTGLLVYIMALKGR